MLRRPRDGTGLWQISQKGRWCYDGPVAWTGAFRGVSGHHSCGHADGGIVLPVTRA